MSANIILISNDNNFFSYISPKIKLRNSDIIHTCSFGDVPEKIDFIKNNIVIINSENCKEETLDLLNLISGTPSFIFGYNEDEYLKINGYNAGMIEYITPMTFPEEFNAKIAFAFNIIAVLDKNKSYRDILVTKNILNENNEVYNDYVWVLEKNLNEIKQKQIPSVFIAIAPDDKMKFLIPQNKLETIILTNIRQNDLLMSYAANKYFLLLRDTDMTNAKKIWKKISTLVTQKIYAGFVSVNSKTREQVINEALHKLHESINLTSMDVVSSEKISHSNNFKINREEFNKKLEKIVTPSFYHIQQKYNDRLFGMVIEQKLEDGCGYLTLKSQNMEGNFKITSPGLSKINIDITYQLKNKFQNKQTILPTNRISMLPNELESGFLEDLLEQFVEEFKKEVENGYS